MDRPALYIVCTGNGEAIVADAAHEWVARLGRRRGERIVETTVLARSRSKNAQILGAEGLDLPEATCRSTTPFTYAGEYRDADSGLTEMISPGARRP